MLPNLMRIASRPSVYSLLCWLLVAVAPHGLAQNYQGKQLVRAELLADTNAIVPASRLPSGCCCEWLRVGTPIGNFPATQACQRK